MRRLAGCSAESPREAALWRVEAQSLAGAPYGTVPPSSTALATTTHLKYQSRPHGTVHREPVFTMVHTQYVPSLSSQSR